MHKAISEGYSLLTGLKSPWLTLVSEKGLRLGNRIREKDSRSTYQTKKVTLKDGRNRCQILNSHQRELLLENLCVLHTVSVANGLNIPSVNVLSGRNVFLNSSPLMLPQALHFIPFE